MSCAATTTLVTISVIYIHICHTLLLVGHSFNEQQQSAPADNEPFSWQRKPWLLSMPASVALYVSFHEIQLQQCAGGLHQVQATQNMDVQA
jgi:hypothetical protein